MGFDNQPEPVDANTFLKMSSHERDSYLRQGGVPPELTQEQVAQLPQVQKDDYYRAYYFTHGNSPWWFGSALASAHAHASNTEDRHRLENSGADVQYVDGLQPSDAAYLGHDHSALQRYVVEDLDPVSAEEISLAYHDLYRAFEEFAEDLRDAVTKSQQEWGGDGADAAHSYFTSLKTWSEANSHNAELASSTLARQSEAASTAKTSMPEPIPFDLEQEMESWGSNPFTVHEQISQAIQKMKDSRAAHEQAAQVMHQYDTQLYEAASKQPLFAEPPTFGGGSGDSGGGPSEVIRVPETSVDSGSADSDTRTSGFVDGSVPKGSVSSFTSRSGGVGDGGIGTPSPTPPAGSGPSTGAGVVPPMTRPSGLNPGGMTRPPAGGRGSQRSGFGPGGMGAVPAAGLAGGFGPGGGAGGGGYSGGRVPGAGFGPGGGAGGAGAGAGAGAATGARPMGGAAAAGPGAAAAAGAGAAGRGGMGAAPMGAGAGAGKGGQGGEDNEHQRPTYLVEADPDDVFGTDQRTAPPVIGA